MIIFLKIHQHVLIHGTKIAVNTHHGLVHRQHILGSKINVKRLVGFVKVCKLFRFMKYKQFFTFHSCHELYTLTLLIDDGEEVFTFNLG